MRFLALAASALLMAVAAAPPAVPAPAPSAPRPGAPAAAPAPTPAPRPAVAAAALTPADLNAWLDGFMPSTIANADIAGAVVVVVRDGAVLTARGYGHADVASGRPVDPARTLFRQGSVSKLVTWTAVMQLVEAGKLDLDTDVNRYLDFTIPPYHGKPITLRQIMTHTAGFEEAAKDLIHYAPQRVDPLGAYLKSWTPHRIFAPGTTPAYSNWATTLAGYIVERASGQSFDSYVEQRIFAPLGMTTASFRQPLPAALRPLMATGYTTAGTPAKAFEIVTPAPAGSMSASGLDMAKFMIAHLAGGRGILRPETAAMMHDSPTAKVDPLSLIPPLNRMELGFFETNMNGREIIGHLGDTQDFHTALHLFMREGVGLYVSFNSAGKEGAAHHARTALLEDFADRYFPAAPRPPRAAIDPRTAAREAAALVGSWQSSRRADSSFLSIVNLFGQAQVSLDDKGGLVIPMLTDRAGNPETWHQIAPLVWQNASGHSRLAAKEVDGRIVRWSVDLTAPFMVFERVEWWRDAAWLVPALLAGLGVLALTFLFWPAAWLVRRRYGAAMPLAGRSLAAYRVVRITAGLTLAVLGGWAALIAMFSADIGAVSDGALWLLQIAGAVVFVGGFAAAAWNLWLTWRERRGWLARLWSVLVLLAAAVVLHVAIAYGLIAMSVNY